MVMEMDEFGHDQLDQLVEAAMKRDEPYVDQNLLGSACVQVGTLDLKPTICYGAYSGLELVPLSSGELKSILNSGPNHQKALEPDEYVYSGSESEDGIPRTSASADRKRFRVAFALAKDVDRYLVCTKILDKTGWKIRAFEHEEFLMHDETHRFTSRYLLDCYCGSENTSTLSKDRPFVTLHQVDKTPLREGRVLLSELNAIACLATEYDKMEAYDGCNAYMATLRKVTVITGSGRQMRVTQGMVDFVGKKFTINVSEALDFTGGFASKRDNWDTILGWFAARPVAVDWIDPAQNRSEAPL